MRVPAPGRFDGRLPLFRIGTTPLDPAAWIEPDERLTEYLEEKDRLLATRMDEVFVAEPTTADAQDELLGLLAEHLVRHFPDLWRRYGDMLEIVPARRGICLTGSDTPALLRAARLVQEDLVLMRRAEAGWRLAAGAVCFPSSWRLAEKFGRPIDAVHAGVPGFGAGTRNAELIVRMFDMMRPEAPMLRWNWSVYGDAALFHPEPPPPRRFGAGIRARNVILRVERQTLRKLPRSGDIVFTIRIDTEPLTRLARQPDAARIAGRLVAQIEALDPDQLAYKGLTLERERLLARLREIAER